MTSALIGFTGFVGGSVASQRSFDEYYRSTNIEDMAGRSYELVVCCGAPGVKWLANKEPEKDLAAIRRLMSALGQIRSRVVVLVSTVDVYPLPRGVDELTPIDPETVAPYGKHRLLLERFVAERFERFHVMRLPGLFGPGLKKNAIYDLLNDHQTEKIDHRAVFQFYSTERLWADIERVVDAGLPLVNWSTEPVSVAEMALKSFAIDFRQETDAAPARYDMRTAHAARFGQSGSYIYSRDEVLTDLRRYVARARGGRP
ncbi:MAG: pyridine nucleotide transhydrogenase [Deltaproteobacteria bacterium]|nr:pyridine nucleotide transhydrogenase [Deltaproteobacteria bacterium]